MSGFSIDTESKFGRLGNLYTENGTVETPAFFPVLNLIGGTTRESGGIWRYIRDDLIKSDQLSGVMMQAMSFTEYGVTPENLDDFWRQPNKGLHDHFPELKRPIFIDSGGFKLMNSQTFGKPPSAGGQENPWDIYTNPQSILELQLDFGADIIATLDYPIPPNLQEEERRGRLQRSIDSAVRCLELLEDRPENPAVFVAIHGHDYDTINWYVSHVLEDAQGLEHLIDGFAVGSLVPLRGKVDMVVDIVQGARDALPDGNDEKYALHLFGVTGRLMPLLSLLGVDSYDSTTYQQLAQNKRLLRPDSWERINADELENESWDCDCPVCQDLDVEIMKEVLYSDTSYSKIETREGDYWKSEFYAKIARHNFEVFERLVRDIRQSIERDELLELVATHAQDHNPTKQGLKLAQVRDPSIGIQLEELGKPELLAGPEERQYQTKFDAFAEDISDDERGMRTISLEHGPADFNLLREDFEPPSEKPHLLLLPCSRKKPYRDSKTQSVILENLGEVVDDVHRVSVSGLYGPVPEEFEDIPEIMSYDYVLTTNDPQQINLVQNRLEDYLKRYGDQYDTIVGYTTIKAYRIAMEGAFKSVGIGELLPRDPRTLQVREHFRQQNIDELINYIVE